MNSDLWIHSLLFITVFIVTGILWSKRMKKKEESLFKAEYQEIQAEVLEAGDLIKQAKLEKDEARKEKEKAEELMRIATEEWDHKINKMQASCDDMKNPYVILGVHENDTLDTIKEVYRKLIAIYHPDKHDAADDLSQEQKKELTERIKAAYEWIINHDDRHETSLKGDKNEI